MGSPIHGPSFSSTGLRPIPRNSMGNLAKVLSQFPRSGPLSVPLSCLPRLGLSNLLIFAPAPSSDPLIAPLTPHCFMILFPCLREIEKVSTARLSCTPPPTSCGRNSSALFLLLLSVLEDASVRVLMFFTGLKKVSFDAFESDACINRSHGEPPALYPANFRRLIPPSHPNTKNPQVPISFPPRFFPFWGYGPPVVGLKELEPLKVR